MYFSIKLHCNKKEEEITVLMLSLYFAVKFFLFYCMFSSNFIQDYCDFTNKSLATYVPAYFSIISANCFAVHSLLLIRD